MKRWILIRFFFSAPLFFSATRKNTTTCNIFTRFQNCNNMKRHADEIACTETPDITDIFMTPEETIKIEISKFNTDAPGNLNPFLRALHSLHAESSGTKRECSRVKSLNMRKTLYPIGRAKRVGTLVRFVRRVMHLDQCNARAWFARVTLVTRVSIAHKYRWEKG